MENYKAKDLIDRLGKFIGARFELRSLNGKDYMVIAVKSHFSGKEYDFFIEGFRSLRTINWDDAPLDKDGKEEWLWEQALDMMLDMAREKTLVLEKYGRIKSSGFPGIVAPNAIVLEKGIYSREQLEIWLDL